jgi:hypothetical protein
VSEQLTDIDTRYCRCMISCSTVKFISEAVRLKTMITIYNINTQDEVRTVVKCFELILYSTAVLHDLPVSTLKYLAIFQTHEFHLIIRIKGDYFPEGC